MPYVVAALVGGALGAIEQYNRLKTPVTKADWAWALWLGRVLLEAGIGVAALAIVKKADAKLAESALVWIAAGAAGPAVVRLRIIDVGPSEDPTPIGLAAAYEPVRNWIADRIDDIGAAAQARWITEDLMPALNLRDVEPKEIADRYNLWVEGSSRFTVVTKLEERDYVESTIASSDPREIKRELIVRRALKLKAFRVLRDLHKSCSKEKPPAARV